MTIAMLEAGYRQGDDDLLVGEAQKLAPLGVVMNRRTGLRQAGMKVDRVRHDGGTDDADR